MGFRLSIYYSITSFIPIPGQSCAICLVLHKGNSDSVPFWPLFSTWRKFYVEAVELCFIRFEWQPENSEWTELLIWFKNRQNVVQMSSKTCFMVFYYIWDVKYILCITIRTRLKTVFQSKDLSIIFLTNWGLLNPLFRNVPFVYNLL